MLLKFIINLFCYSNYLCQEFTEYIIYCVPLLKSNSYCVSIICYIHKQIRVPDDLYQIITKYFLACIPIIYKVAITLLHNVIMTKAVLY